MSNWSPNASTETLIPLNFDIHGKTGAGTSMNRCLSIFLTQTTSRIRHVAGWATFLLSSSARRRMYRFISLLAARKARHWCQLTGTRWRFFERCHSTMTFSKKTNSTNS